MSATPEPSTRAKRETLAARPGWEQLRRAGAELHAAEVLLGDPIAEDATALVHLRAYWTAIHAAGQAARLGDPAGETPAAWLGAPISGLDKGTRAKLRRQLGELDAGLGEGLSARFGLRAHARSARELFEALEPLIGGVPLRRRRLRRLWGTVAVVLLLGPLASYYALTRKIEGAGPWRATYYADRELDKELTVLRELTVDHDWASGAPLEAVPPDKFSVAWDTCVVLPEVTNLVLQVNANDGARVLVDGEPVIEAWERDPKTRKRGSGSGAVELDAGIHHLRAEYFESMGKASIKLSASFDDEIPAAIPSASLRYPGDRIDEDDPCAGVREASGE